MSAWGQYKMITIEHLYQQIEVVNNTLSTMLAGLQRLSPASAANEINPYLLRSTIELGRLYSLAGNLAKQQDDLASKNISLKLRLSSIQAAPSISTIGHENFRLNYDYIDIQELYRQTELVVNSTDNLNTVVSVYVMHFGDNEITLDKRGISEGIVRLLYMIDNFIAQLDSLIKEHNFLRLRLADLEQSSNNNSDMQADSLSITKECENPRLDFDSPEAKQIFSGVSVPPLLISSNIPSSSSSAFSSSNSSAYPSPMAPLTNDFSPEIFGNPLFYVPPLILSSAARSYSSSDHSPPNSSSTSSMQLEANENNCRKKTKHIEDEQQLKRTKKHYNLLSLI